MANTVAVYERVLREDRGLEGEALAARGAQARERIGSYRPALAEEIEGIAEGAEQPSLTLFAINARTELLAGGALAGGECSTVAVVDEAAGSALLAQNWDFHPALRASRVVWSIEHGAGRFTRTFTEAGIVGKAGVNSAGLGLAINFLATDRDGGLDGVPVHVLCRTILDEARTVEDAIGLVEGAAVCASVCLTVAGQSGDGGHRAVALERWPDGVEAVATSTERPWVVHTNHFVREIPAHDLLAAGESAASTTDRLLQLTRALERDGALGADGAAALLSSRGEPGLEPIFRLDDPSVPWSQRCATLATILIESPSGRLSVRAA